MNVNETRIQLPPSADIAAQKRDQLRQLFPEVFSEGKIDFDALRRSLGDWVEPPGIERFGLSWPGKADCMRTLQQPSIATLKPDRNASRDFDTSQNLVIEGDNLEVLKLLQTAYAGKVKMIYIDPPYNTGKEFIYPDRYSETLDTYLDYTNQTDDHGRRWGTNTEQDGRYHSNWLNMMFPRLYLARNLLREDGVIFISIDDHEQANLKLLCDYVFGEENFVANVIWEGGLKNDSKYISNSHDFIICYSKNEAYLRENKTVWRTKKEGVDKIYDFVSNLKMQYGNDFNLISQKLKQWFSDLPKSEPAKAHKHYNQVDQNGIYFPDNLSWPGGGGPRYEVLHPITQKPVTIPSRGWSISKLERMKELIQQGKIHFGADETKVPNYKRYLHETEGQVLSSVHYKDRRAAVQRLTSLFGCNAFETPKDEDMISKLIEATTSSDDLILDFFAGSGTTGHAVMQQNAEDGGRRRYILVQLPEPTPPDSEARRAGYRTIADITRERLRRAADRIAASQATPADQLFSDSETKPPPDLGFRAFYLDRSNLRVWTGEVPTGPDRVAQLEKQLELHVDHILPEATDEGLLYEFLLKYGFPLTVEVKRLTLAGVEVFSVESDADGVGGLIFCPAATGLTMEALEAMADQQPAYTIVLEKAFKGQDHLLTNAAHTFRKRSEQAGYEMAFWTL